MMRDEEQEQAWRQAMAKFSTISDGFCILGYDKKNKRKFVFGMNKNAAAGDGLFIIRHRAMEWMGADPEQEEEEL
jgi:hypothetical protein